MATTPTTPSRSFGHTPRLLCCNRCIRRLKVDITIWPCDGQFGVLARKCTVCARSRHKCVEVEQVLYPQLRTVVAARDAHVAAVRSSNTAEQQEQQQEILRCL
ncbi:hypothetical protein M433DRAFT_9920 [Acidomyces richmondensis BFW]|nr:hypothetical protein M433DRAFT_9920 [Acidomyces richmondensis BFW]